MNEGYIQSRPETFIFLLWAKRIRWSSDALRRDIFLINRPNKTTEHHHKALLRLKPEEFKEGFLFVQYQEFL